MEDKNLKVKNLNEKKEKKEWTVKRILTTVIIAILALLMVGGSFYYIFSPGFRKSSNAFGFYDKEPVLYESNNVFARTLMSDENYANAAAQGDFNALYQSWYAAYQSQVVYIALSKLAEKADIISPDALVSKMAIESGTFNNENGEFDQAIYDSVSDVDKRMYVNYIKSIYPYETVIEDIFTTLTSAQEAEFISASASDTKSFEYFVVGPNMYPDPLARDYAEENKKDYTLIDISMISCLSEEDAKACYDELNAGLSWEEAVAKYSYDSYKTNNGSIGGPTFAGVFKDNLKDEADFDKLIALNVGAYTAPIDGAYAWTIYKLNDETRFPDLYNADELVQVKQMIYAKNPDLVQSYIDDGAVRAEEYAKNDFDYAAEIFGLGKVEVGPVANNIGGSSVVYGIESYDLSGGFASVVNGDADLNKALFSEKIGYVAGPIDVDGSYLFVKVTGESVEKDLGELTLSLFDFYRNQFDLVDTQNSIVTSSKHEDNFTTKFIDMFLVGSN